MYQNFIIPYLYEAQHISGEKLTIIRRLKLHWQPLVFAHGRLLDMWLVDNIHQPHVKVVGRVACGQRPPATHPTTFHV
jgi:hypothetical protein